MWLHEVLHVARCEMKLQRREWLFWILVVLGVVVVPLFQFFTQSKEVSVRWNMVAFPGSMPFVNAYLFNIVQAFLLAFASTGLLLREQPNGSTSCFWVRPFVNEKYCLGKWLGLCGTFLSVNVASIAVSCLLNLFYSHAPFNLGHYLFYLLTLTLPTLVFFSGLGCWLSGLFRAPFFVSLLLLGLTWLSLSPFSGNFHGLLDMLGNSQANLISDVTGHVNGLFYGLHRSCFFLLGCGFFLAGVPRFRRLPCRSLLPCVLGGVLLALAGLLCGVWSEHLHAGNTRARELYREAFKRHWQASGCRVRAHDLTVEQRGARLRGESVLTLYNPGNEVLSRIVLYLNPGLQVEAVHSGNQPVKWERDAQVLLLPVSLAGGDSVTVQVRYAGEIDERYCALTRTEAELFNTSRHDEVFRFGRRFAFVGDDYLLLTPAVGWYPVAVPTENVRYPLQRERDFTRYRIRVVAPRQRVVLSQGVARRRQGSDTLTFAPTHPLEGITLCGGDYKMEKISHAGISLYGYYFKGHDFRRLWPRASFQETGKVLIANLCYQKLHLSGDHDVRMLKEDKRTRLGASLLAREEWCEPETRRLLLVETPLAFDPVWEETRLGSERVQPGMILLPERMTGHENPNTLPSNANKKRRMKMRGLTEEQFDIEQEHVLFNSINQRSYARAVSNPFFRVVKKSSDVFGQELQTITQKNTYYWHSLISPEVDVVSTSYPLLDMVLKMHWRTNETNLFRFQATRRDPASTRRFLSGVPDDGEENIARAQWLLRGRSLEEVLGDETLSNEERENVLRLKGKELQTYLGMENPWALTRFLTGFYRRHHSRQTVALETLIRELQDSLGVDLERVLPEWYGNQHDARFFLKDICWERYKGDNSMYFSCKIFNASETPGVIKLQNRTGANRIFRVPGREARAVRWVWEWGNEEALGIDVGSSLHVPSLFTMHQTSRSGKLGLPEMFEVLPVDTVGFREERNEFLVDNEDPGFRVEKSGLTWLRQWLNNDHSIAGGRWKRSLNSRSHGETLRSFHAKRGGDARSRVVWTVELPEAGRYEVKVLVYRNQVNFDDDLYKKGSMNFGMNLKDSVKFYYVVSHDGGETPVVVETMDKKKDRLLEKFHKRGYADPRQMREIFYTDWVSLGIYDFSRGKGSVALSDKGARNDMVIADAVKWVKVD